MPPTSENRTEGMLETRGPASVKRPSRMLSESDPIATALRVLGLEKMIQITTTHQPRTEMTMSQGRARFRSKPDTPSIVHNGCQYKSLVNAMSDAKEIATFTAFPRRGGAFARGPLSNGSNRTADQKQI